MSTSPGFLCSTGWGRVLSEGFGAEMFITDNVVDSGDFPITVFHKGPFKIAYPNFPVGIASYEDWIQFKLLLQQSNPLKQKVDLIRLSLPEMAAIQDRYFAKALLLPETVIENLADWNESKLDSKVRYEIRRSRREGTTIRCALANEGMELYRMYASTVRRHRGAPRYPIRYFDALCRLAQDDTRLEIGIVLTPGGETCGFVVIAHDVEMSYYLHAGMHSGGSRFRPGYLAMTWAIESARRRGQLRFNMLTSPISQPALQRFKESWGGVTHARHHMNLATSLKGGFLKFALGIRAYFTK